MCRWLREHRGLLRGARANLVVLALFAAFSFVGFSLLNNAFVRNEEQSILGYSHYCASEIKGGLSVYGTLVDFGTRSLEDALHAGEVPEAYLDWIEMYGERMRAALDDDTVTPHAVVEGYPLEMDGWSSATGTAVGARTWRAIALAHPGEVVFTDIHDDEAAGGHVVTIAQASADGDVVFAVDILPEHLSSHFDLLEMEGEDSLYVCDSAGTPLYMRSALEAYDERDVDAYLRDIVGRINTQGDESGQLIAIDLQGAERTVSYTRMDNSWIAIVTAPYRMVAPSLAWVLLMFVATAVFFVLAVGAMTWRDVRRHRAAERTNEIVRALGNSYLSIYLVNYKKGTYEVIRPSAYVGAHLPPRGPYGELIRAAVGVIEDDAYREFAEQFSAESIEALVKRHAWDFGGDFLGRFDDGSRWVNARILYDGSLDPDEVILSFREVDREKQRQLRERRYLEEALESSRRSLEAKAAFFSNMSHEMRTPLNGIIGMTGLAKRVAGNPERTRDYLAKIEASGRQMLALVNDILEISRMEQGLVPFSPERIDIVEQVQQAMAPFFDAAAVEGKVLKATFDVVDREVLGDPVRLDQILNNLLSNALKYTRSGGSVRVSLTQDRAGAVGSYRLVVADTGIGMDPAYLPRIFELYSRERRFDAPRAEGTGLGMPITKNLVDQMGGTISVESEVDRGTTFTVILPFARAEEEGGDAVAESDPCADGDPLAALVGAHVLVAEDNEVNMEIVAEMLSAVGVDVAKAWDGRQAVDAFISSQPFAFDAILMDMNMPVLDGLGAARAIRASGRADAGLPIIAVTANAFAEDVNATAVAGMDAHVSKPIDFAALCSALVQKIAAHREALGGAPATDDHGR